MEWRTKSELPARRAATTEAARPRRRPSVSSRPDHELVAAVRAELAAVEPARACCRAAERAGLAGAPPSRTSSGAVARLLVRLEPESPRTPPRAWAYAAEHCRVAYLRGRFLACGSLSLAGGHPHLEFVVSVDEAPVLSAQLGDVGLPAAWRVRRGRGVVTWKRTEAIVTFLRRAGASATALELEARLVTRTLRGQLNRVINAEEANLQRSVTTAGRQLVAIERLRSSGRLERLPEEVRAVADLRWEAPEATFTDLARRSGTTRSFVQRALAKLEALAEADAEAAAAPLPRSGT